MFFLAVGVGFLAASLLLRYSPRTLTNPPPGAITGLVILAASVAAAADGAATGWEPLDWVLRMLLGALLVWSGSVVGRAAPLVATLALGALLLVSGSPATALGGLALGTAILASVAGDRLPLGGALVGGLVAQVVLRLEADAFTGASALAGVVVTLVLVIPALGRVPERARRPARALVGAVALVGGVGVVGGAVAALGVAGHVDAAVESAERGLDLIGDDPDAAKEALTAAAGRFGDAEARLDAPWALPARAVPFLAQQVRAVETMASAGGDLAAVAADSVEEADIDGVRPVDGKVDLAALRDLQAPLGRADDALAEARARLASVETPWLVGPIANRRSELAEQVEGAADSAEVAAQAVDALPAMLGGDGIRRYLLLVQQPAEARGSGGLPGNWGEIVADDGQLDLVEFGRIRDLIDGGTPAAERTVDMPGAFDALYGYEDYLIKWQNVTFTPDFTVAAELARQLYPQSGGQEIDGVVSIDPSGVAAVLGLTGPVDLPDGTQLSADNAESRLYFEQYVALDTTTDANETRIDLLGDAAEETWAALTSGALPGPRALADALGPAVAGRHLQVEVFDDEAELLLSRTGLSGRMPQPSGDGVGVVTQNIGENKIDWFVDRSTAYDVAWDPSTGAVGGTYSVTFANRAPVAGLPGAIIGWGGPNGVDYATTPGESLSLVYLYTAMPPTALRSSAPIEEQGDTQLDGRWFVTPLRVRVPGGESVTVELDVLGELAEGAPWTLDTVRQPTINGDELSVELAVPGDWSLRATPGLEIVGEVAQGSLDLDVVGGLQAGAVATGTLLSRQQAG